MIKPYKSMKKNTKLLYYNKLFNGLVYMLFKTNSDNLIKYCDNKIKDLLTNFNINTQLDLVSVDRKKSIGNLTINY
jgi:hypothetical protein